MPYGWELMTESEKSEFFEGFHAALLEHRYRYYVQDHPILQDHEYDGLEKLYGKLVQVLGISSPTIMDMVGYDFSRNDCLAAEQRILQKTDAHSRWKHSMRPIWDRLGYPRSWTRIGWPG